MKHSLSFPVAAIALAFSITAGHAQSNVTLEAKIVVTTEVARPADKVPPLGANDFGGRGVQAAAGNYIVNAGNERPVWQNMHRAVKVEDRSFELDSPGGTSWYKLWADGFLSGAKVRIYRIVDKAGGALEVADNGRVKMFKEIPAGAHVILVGSTTVIPEGKEGFPKGGWVVDAPPPGKKPNRVYLSADSPELKEFDYVVLEKDLADFNMDWVHNRVRSLPNASVRPQWPWTLKPEDTKLSFSSYNGQPPAGMIEPGDSALLIEPTAGRTTMSQTRFIGPDQDKESLYYTQLEPGKNYRLEVWLRQEGLGDGGKVTFFINPEKTSGHAGIRSAFTVDGMWKKYTYDFVAPARPVGSRHYGPAFSFTGPGKLWMDNSRLFRFDSPKELELPYVPDPDMLAALVASQPATGPKGTHRIWVLERDITMDSLLSLHPSSQLNPGWRTSITSQNKDLSLPQELLFDFATGDSPSTRMMPHIVMQHILHDEQDWLNFVEYMAAPYDAKTDTPKTKPWAYKRTLQRGGNGTPWTDEFREVIVELGNETWHNGKPDDWIGFSTLGAVHRGGPEYGLFADFLITQIKSSPWWNKAKLDGKIKFNLGSNYSGRVEHGMARGYGEEAIQRTSQAAYVGRANYVGPKWETGDKPLATFDNDGLLATIMGYQIGVKASQERTFEAQKLLAQKGIVYDLIAYEGGPSGYSIDRETRKIPGLVESAERYGKSQAMAVASLDAWLGSYLQGWTYQNYFSFQQGQYWSSHTMRSDGFRPHISWLAMTLRNRFASGALMKVETVQLPTIEHTEGKETTAQIPLVGVYAMRDGDRWSVFVLSRKIDGQAHGIDFGDGYSAVSLKLPFKSAAKISLHKLAGNPRANNITSEEVKIESLSLNPRQPQFNQNGAWQINETTGGDKKGLPPAAIFLYVFEGVK
ncbi:hypothetical protein [Rariglobus hedericola]|uniref:CBM-cenC domain-containing protein n=1 Tax=Rariglobus hedericola TaxID=2597822 RepID=A0A556QPH1_9BACT|nr:hypothetical protein [Rariglobus hedericola]TSJ78527.1 hypothetical protein FPL22_04300 [Rariglobus hedericola]